MIQIDVIKDAQPVLCREDVEIAIAEQGLDWHLFDIGEFEECEWAEAAATIHGGDEAISVVALQHRLCLTSGSQVEVTLYPAEGPIAEEDGNDLSGATPSKGSTSTHLGRETRGQG